MKSLLPYLRLAVRDIPLRPEFSLQEKLRSSYRYFELLFFVPATLFNLPFITGFVPVVGASGLTASACFISAYHI